MKQVIFLSLVLALAVGIVASISCTGGGGGKKAAVGSSCEGIGSMEARMACDGANSLFCSSLTDYKFKVQNTCPEGQICKLSADGKSTSCVAP